MPLRDALRSARRLLGLSPMQKVMRTLQRRGHLRHRPDALELFGGTGAFHTLDYARRVAHLEAWELDHERAAAFRRNLPDAKIHIADAYSLAKSERKRYGLIVVDNPASKHGEHFEHFDLFPALFRLAGDHCTLVLNVIPTVDAGTLRRFPALADPDHHRARAAFYRTGTPLALDHEIIARAYERLADENGFDVADRFFVRRHAVWYCVVVLLRKYEV